MFIDWNAIVFVAITGAVMTLLRMAGYSFNLNPIFDWVIEGAGLPRRKKGDKAPKEATEETPIDAEPTAKKED